MKFSKFYIDHFGKLSDTTIDLKDGINVIAGYNESGKTTLHTFISSMIFGLERGRGRAAKSDDYTRFNPWDGGTYGGKIEVVKDDTRYSISRIFTKDASSISVRNESTFEEESEEILPEIFPGLSPSSYNNTISVKQLSASTGGELADELKNHIINLRTAGAYNLNVSGALENLRLQKKKILSGYSKEISIETEELATRISVLEGDLNKDDPGMNLPSLEKKKADTEKKLLDLESEKDRIKYNAKVAINTLKSHHIENPDDADVLSKKVEDATAYVNEFVAKHRFSTKPFAKKLYRVLLVLFLVLLFGSVGFAIYSKVYNLEAMFFTIALGVAAVSLVLAIGFIVFLANTNTFNKKCMELCEIYSSLFGEYPEGIGKEEIEKLREEPMKYQKYLSSISEAKARYKNICNEIELLKKGTMEINGNLEIAKKFAWSREQKEDALTALRLREDMLKDGLEKNERLMREANAIDLAINTIEKISNDVFESFGHFLEDTTSALINSMTDGSYTGVSIDDSFDISLLQGERKVDLSCVSSGTLDQVYLALRLACIEFMWPDETMPLLLDDTFAMYDRNRLALTLSWLSENYSGQILIFTCHERETDILNNLNIPYNLIEM